MLHVRVVSPAALTDQLTVRLAAAPGVQNMVVRDGAARRPAGDAVEFDVRDGAANPVFAARRELASAGVSAPRCGTACPVADLINKPNVFSVIVAAGLSTQRAIWRGRRP